MITAEAEFQIDRPPEQVFDFWADVRNENEWNPGSQGWEQTRPRISGKRFDPQLTS